MVGTAFSQTPLPKGAKLKTIIFPKNGVVTVGYVYKNQFVENQGVTFLELPNSIIPQWYITENKGIAYINNPNNKEKTRPLSSLDTIASGVYFIKNGTACIEGIVYSKFVSFLDNRAVYKGVFQISNTEAGNTLTTDPKEAIYSYSSSGKLKVNAVTIYSYQGYFNNKKGTVNDSNIPVTLQKQLDDYILKIEFNDRILEAVVSSDKVRKSNLYFDFDDFIISSQNVKLTDKNGNVFTGIVEKYGDQYKPKEGKYIYANGEVYTGIMNIKSLGDRNVLIHEQGKTVFADGTTANGDWTKQYNFTYDEWNEIWKNSKTLTEARDMANNLNKEKGKAENDRLEIAKQEFYAKYPFAKSKPNSKSSSTQNSSSAMDDLFPEVSNIKVGMSYQELKETLPLELYNKSLTTVQGKQAIYLTPSNSKIQEFLADKLKITPKSEVEKIAPSLITLEMALKMKGKSWADAFPIVTLLNDKVYSVSMSQ